MIHPNTRLHFINEAIGYGVFATEFIPRGTITYVKDALEPEVTPQEFHHQTPQMQEAIEKYSYIDERGNRIISWDFGKYVNHCCHCNTMSTGYGFEIAIRDIRAGEEITDEYGMFNMEEAMTLSCKYEDCRGKVSKRDFETYFEAWDLKVQPALNDLLKVDQPLYSLLSSQTMEMITSYFNDPSQYRSVYALKYHGYSSNGQSSKSLTML